MAKQTFTAGQTLTAQQMNDLQTNDFNLSVSTQTANYTLQAADKGTREVMNMGSAGTVTIPNSTFDAGDTVWVHSIGSGTISLVAGAGMTLNSSAGTAPTLAQWEGGVVYFTSASAAIFFRGAGVKVLAIDAFLVAGGGGGAADSAGDQGGGGGGAGGALTVSSGYLAAGTYTVTVGAGGAGATAGYRSIGYPGGASYFGSWAAIGGGGGGIAQGSNNGANGGSGGGEGGNAGTFGSGISGQGNNGGTSSAQTNGGGGGGAGGVGGNGSSTTGGAGGAATTNNWTDTTYTVSGGGGGMGSVTGGTGGTNAGNGSSGSAASGSGTANNGGGGGGQYGTSNPGGSGGSGRVIIRFLTSNLNFTVSTTGSPTTGTNGNYTWYMWTGSGSFTLA